MFIAKKCLSRRTFLRGAGVAAGAGVGGGVGERAQAEQGGGPLVGAQAGGGGHDGARGVIALRVQHRFQNGTSDLQIRRGLIEQARGA